MAFNGPKKNAFENGKQTHEKMTEALNNKPNVEQVQNVQTQPTINYSLPTKTPVQKEKVKPFTFTLKPSNRKALNKIAKRHGYTSTSSFLDDWIEQNKDN